MTASGGDSTTLHQYGVYNNSSTSATFVSHRSTNSVTDNTVQDSATDSSLAIAATRMAATVAATTAPSVWAAV